MAVGVRGPAASSPAGNHIVELGLIAYLTSDWPRDAFLKVPTSKSWEGLLKS